MYEDSDRDTCGADPILVFSGCLLSLFFRLSTKKCDFSCIYRKKVVSLQRLICYLSRNKHEIYTIDIR